VEKMRAILLMEADFNFMNKMIYGDRMLATARRYGYMAEEIFSERGCTAEDGSLAKVLFYDIVRQFDSMRQSLRWTLPTAMTA
jgi:hypothetical protein